MTQDTETKPAQPAGFVIPAPTDYKIPSGEKHSIGLGDEVVEAMTGFKGTVSMIATDFSGSIMYTLQPLLTDNTFKDGLTVDENMTFYVGPGVSALVPKLKPVVVDFVITDMVRDDLSGFTGRVTKRADYANGCTYFNVTKLDDKGKLVVETFDWQRLHKVVEAPSVDVARPPTPADRVAARPGGPMERAASRIAARRT